MNYNKELVVNALRYYDKNNDLYTKIFNKIKYYSFQLSEFDMEHNIIIFYDRKKNEIFRSRYEYIGIYNPLVEIWIWAWAIPVLKKNQTGLIRKVLNYGVNLDSDSIFLKSELITSRFKITNVLQLDMHVAIASYISKQGCVIPIIDNQSPVIEHDGQDITKISTDINENTILVNYLYLLDIDNIL